MKKIISLALSCLAIAVLLCACGSEEKTPAVSDVADAIQKAGTFSELVNLTDDNIGRRYFGIDLEKIEEYDVRVCSSGALADELAVFKMKNHDDVEDMLDIVKERQQELYDSFVDYVPTEVTKIQQAVIASKGNYVYFILCENKNAAKEAVEGLF